MKNRLNIRDFAILQAVVVLYTFSTVIGKFAATAAEEGGSLLFLVLYAAEIGVLGLYAICWQQVIKRVELSVAYANRAMALLWSLLWAVLIFGDRLSFQKLAGVALVIAGTVIINGGGKKDEN
ncbi:MAG: transporter [Eubacteriales bacterium]|nr:transporter [Eubacteriales bacterium]